MILCRVILLSLLSFAFEDASAFSTAGHQRSNTVGVFTLSKSLHPTVLPGTGLRRPKNDRSSRVERKAMEGEDSKMDAKVAGRKKRLTMGYKLASFAYVASTVVSLLTWGGISSSSLYYVLGGGPVTAAVVLYILEGAASNDRLNSETYKRLNLATIAFSLVQLAMPTNGLPLMSRLAFKVPGLLGFVNGIKGYGYGCLGWDKSEAKSVVLKDFTGGIGSTIQGMTVLKPKSAGYFLGTLMLGSMSLIKAKELATMWLVPSASPTPATVLSVFVRLSKMARLGFMATIMYTLKDASDRDRLSGTTFVQLNYLAAAAFASITFYLLPTWGNLSSNGQILLAAGLSAMTLWKGFNGKKKK